MKFLKDNAGRLFDLGEQMLIGAGIDSENGRENQIIDPVNKTL